MDQQQKPKKLVIRRSTIGALRMQTGVKTGGTCDNACGDRSGTCPEVVTKCPAPPEPSPSPALNFHLKA